MTAGNPGGASRRPEAAGTGLLWVTNIPVPYRWSLWRDLAELAPTEVVCLAGTQRNQAWVATPAMGSARLAIVGARGRFVFGDTIYMPSYKLGRLLHDRRPVALYVDGWESPAYWQVLLWARRRNIRTAIGYRSTADTHRFRSGPIALVRRWVLRSADVVVVAGERSRQGALGAGVDPSRIVTAENAVDVKSISDDVQRLRAKQVPAVGHRTLYVGQLVSRKNVQTLVRSWAQSATELDSLSIVGDGPEMGALIELTEALGIAERVYLRGHLEGDPLFEEYAAAHTFALVSTAEVWGLVVNEALASGLHMVLSARAGAAPFVKGMQGTWVVEPDMKSVANALAESRATWSGWNKHPEILDFTPERTAMTIATALELTVLPR